jgi:transposase|tara:strand:+ start:410 stop:811 length:402 start_codon:yes stop_codon:yes gene_type:complete
MTNKIIKRGRPSKFDDYQKKVIELRLEGKFIPAIAKDLGMSKSPIYDWLDKGRQPDAEEKYFLFQEEYKRADRIAIQKDLDEFDEEIAKMSEHTPEYNKYMDQKSRVKERRNRLHGGGDKVNVGVKLRFTSWS